MHYRQQLAVSLTYLLVIGYRRFSHYRSAFARYLRCPYMVPMGAPRYQTHVKIASDVNNTNFLDENQDQDQNDKTNIKNLGRHLADLTFK